MALSSTKIEKVTDSNNYYNIYIGKDKKEILFEIMKTCFRGKKRPKAGMSFRWITETVEGKLVSSIYINNEQII